MFRMCEFYKMTFEEERFKSFETVAYKCFFYELLKFKGSIGIC